MAGLVTLGDGVSKKKKGKEVLRIDPESKENKIQYPKVHSEFEVHAELYAAIKGGVPGADVRGKVKAYGTHGLRKTKASCRFDLVVFARDGSPPVCVIEVKGGKVRHKEGIEATRQGQRYVTFGVPVLVCYGFEDIQIVVEEVKKFFQESKDQS